MANKKEITSQIGDIITLNDAIEQQIEIITNEQYDLKQKNAEKTYKRFLDVEEWRKHIEWKTKKIDLYAVYTDKEGEYEVKGVKHYFNTIDSIKHCQTNLDALFKWHPLLNTFKFNVYTRKPEFNNKEYDEDTQPQEIFNFFKRNFNEWCPRQDIKETIQETLNNNEYHPIIDYFNNLVWDGVERLETFLIDYYNAKDEKLLREYFKRWMVAIVKRTYEPGTKFDNMLILSGLQGKKKTTLFEWLGTINGMKYYNDVPENLKDIRQLVYMSKGKMILCFDDFDDICDKGEIGKIKSFVTKRNVTADLKFKHEKDYPVTYALCGTTNNELILVDDNTFDERRFWIIEVHPENDLFDIPDEIKEQLYAEAVYIYKHDKDFKLWIWEQELRDAEAEYQKKFKKAAGDFKTEDILNIFNRKYLLDENGLFKDKEDFISQYNNRYNNLVNQTNEFLGIEGDNRTLQYITIIPSSWIIDLLNTNTRSTDRIVQILHVNGYLVEKRIRYWIYNKLLTCINLGNSGMKIESNLTV